jgi:hypothetical protein
LAYIPETVMTCDDDYVNKSEKKMIGEYHRWKLSTAALKTNIPLTSWGNEMKFTEKIEK